MRFSLAGYSTVICAVGYRLNEFVSTSLNISIGDVTVDHLSGTENGSEHISFPTLPSYQIKEIQESSIGLANSIDEKRTNPNETSTLVEPSLRGAVIRNHQFVSNDTLQSIQPTAAGGLGKFIKNFAEHFEKGAPRVGENYAAFTVDLNQTSTQTVKFKRVSLDYNQVRGEVYPERLQAMLIQDGAQPPTVTHSIFVAKNAKINTRPLPFDGQNKTERSQGNGSTGVIAAAGGIGLLSATGLALWVRNRNTSRAQENLSRFGTPQYGLNELPRRYRA